ncbi:hypothetical protein BH11PLA1_BH11PLA1_20250 [soil metagenome]
MTFRSVSVSAAALVCLAGSIATAQTPVIDGKRGTDNYGPAKWVNSVNPTGFGDNTALTLTGVPIGDPAAVNRGIELSIPLASINYTSGPLKICAFVISGGQDFLSNQFIGPLAENTENPGEVREINLGASQYPGNQFVSFTPTSGAAPIIDGQLDAAYGAPISVQTNGTGFGDSSAGTVNGLAGATGTGIGSELDALYARTDGTNLYLFFAGNLQPNGNRLAIFFDTDAASGQNLLAGNSSGPVRMSDNDGSGAGLQFDAGFTADYYVALNGDGTSLFVDYATLPTFGLGTGLYAGLGGYGIVGGALTGGDGGAPAITATIDNSNIAGVPGGNTGTFVVRPSPDRSGGSELDAIYTKLVGDKLYVMMTGNLQTNFNKLNIFFSVDGVPGQNRLRAAGDPTNFPAYRPNPDISFGALQKLGGTVVAGVDPATATNGLKFDAGFDASYFLSVNTSENPAQVYLDGAVIRAGGRRQTSGGKSLDYGSFDGGRKTRFPVISYNGPRADQQTNPPNGGLDSIYSNYAPRALGDNIDISATAGPVFPWINSDLAAVAGNKVFSAIDNSNVAGVTDAVGTTNATVAGAVDTGVEIAISLSELGITNLGNIPTIRLCAFINNGSFDFVSNQVSGGLPANNANLGDPRAVDFSSILGNQFIVAYAPPVLRCQPADIADDAGNPLPSAGPNNGVNEGDYNAFFNNFFTNQNVGSPADIASDDGTPLPPFGAPGLPNNGVNEGDYNAFFNNFFNGCPG